MKKLTVFQLEVLVLVVIGQRDGGPVLGGHVGLYLVHELGHLLLGELRCLHPLVDDLTVRQHERLLEHLTEQVVDVVLVPVIIAIGRVEERGYVMAPHIEQGVLAQGTGLPLLPLRPGHDFGDVFTVGQEAHALVEGALVGDVAIIFLEVDYHNTPSKVP